MKIRIEQPVILNLIVSPYGIAAISTLFFLLAWTFPQNLYSDLMGEPDLMFFDAQTLFFFLLCIAGFCAGLLLVDFIFPSRSLLTARQAPPHLGSLAIICPLLVTTVLTFLGALQMYKDFPNAFVLIFAQQGGALKSGFGDYRLGVYGWGIAIQTPVVWWTYWKLTIAQHGTGRPKHRYKFFLWVIFYLGILAQIIISLLRVSRADMMPIIGGLGVLFLMGRIYRRELKTSGLVRYVLFFGLFIIVVFVGLGMIRGAADISAGLTDFVGYTLASYNRLTAVLRGTMHYPYGGHGVYLFMCLFENNFMRALVSTRVPGWPDFLTVWGAEFQAPQLAGLNPNLIWGGAFGYLFGDFGWGTPLILFGYGVLYELIWRQVKSGTALGLTLYPWFAFCALTWFSYNLVFDYRFPFILIGGLMLMAYEKLLSVLHHRSTVLPAVPVSSSP